MISMETVESFAFPTTEIQDVANRAYGRRCNGWHSCNRHHHATGLAPLALDRVAKAPGYPGLLLFAFLPERPHFGEPPDLSCRRNYFGRTEPCCTHRKSRKPQNPPSKLSVHVARQKAHKQWRGAACHKYPRGLAAEQAVPENRILAIAIIMLLV